MSIAVWDVPSPVVTGVPFEVSVGVRCTAGCILKGQLVEVRDAQQRVLASGTIGETPAPGTEGLFFSRVTLIGPEVPGRHIWSIAIPGVSKRAIHTPPDPGVLDFISVVPGDHRVQIQVCDDQTGSPIVLATVRLGPHRAHTDATGTVSLQLPPGTYDVRVMKNTYVAPDRPIVVDSDVELKLAISVPREKDPYERYWKT